MKIRSNYVSNSSSSSFVVIYKSIEDDFKKFDGFDGYYTFVKDLHYSKTENAEKAICDHLDNFYYLNYSQWLYNNFERLERFERKISCCFDWLDFLFEKSKVDSGEYYDLIVEANRNGFEFWNKNKDKLNSDNVSYIQYRESYYDNSQVKNKIEKIGKKIICGLKANGYRLDFVRYSDDSREGCYMETKFMPFLRCNPDKQYEVIVQNEH